MKIIDCKKEPAMVFNPEPINSLLAFGFEPLEDTMRLFDEQIQSLMAQLNNETGEPSVSSYRNIIHNLKNTAGNMGGKELFEFCDMKLKSEIINTVDTTHVINIMYQNFYQEITDYYEKLKRQQTD